VEWEGESDEHVQNLSQLYPVHVTLGDVGFMRLKTLFGILGHGCASHQVNPYWNRTILLVNVISVEGIHL
jgi:hypothetical protein